MRKYNPGFILLEIAVMLVISIIPAVVVYLNTDPSSNLYVLALILSVFTVFLLYISLANAILFPIAKRTMAKKSDEKGLVRTRTFFNNQSNSCASVLVIDETHGKIAYVSAHDPFKLQIADAKDLTDIRADYVKGPFGGTRYVYYQFRYGKKRIRIPTFTSRHMYSTGTKSVQEAIAKANRFRDSVLMLQSRQ